MGFFSKIFSQASELNKLGRAVSYIKDKLDKYEIEGDEDYLLIAAWMYKVGVMDLSAKNEWLPYNVVYVPINGHYTKMNMVQVREMTIIRLSVKVANCLDNKIGDDVQDILSGGKTFYDIDNQMPPELKSVFR